MPKSSNEKSTFNKDNKSRLAIYGDDDPIAVMPEADEFLISAFYELGMCTMGGYGRLPLTWAETAAYSNSCGGLTHWEKQQLIMMSRVFCSCVEKYTDKMDEPPFEREYSEDELAVRYATEAKLMDQSFGF